MEDHRPGSKLTTSCLTVRELETLVRRVSISGTLPTHVNGVRARHLVHAAVMRHTFSGVDGYAEAHRLAIVTGWWRQKATEHATAAILRHRRREVLRVVHVPFEVVADGESISSPSQHVVRLPLRADWTPVHVCVVLNGRILGPGPHTRPPNNRWLRGLKMS